MSASSGHASAENDDPVVDATSIPQVRATCRPRHALCIRVSLLIPAMKGGHGHDNA